MPTRERRHRPPMRALTDRERRDLKEKLQRWQLAHTAAAARIGVSAECLTAALDGMRLQVAKRLKIMGAI